jgi:polysaccharide biosynthesis protein PslG
MIFTSGYRRRRRNRATGKVYRKLASFRPPGNFLKLLNLVAATVFLLSSYPALAQAPQSTPVSLEFFGLHIHRIDYGTPWPDVPFGSWRLWDASVAWPHLEPTRGKWNFSRLDKYVAIAEKRGVSILLPLGLTPRWASARPAEASNYQPGNAAEPSNLELWRNYVRTVASRYKGRIRTYELWNEPNSPKFFSGSVDMLVKLTQIAREELKKVDPNIHLVSPAMSTGSKNHLDYLDKYLGRGGARLVDVIGYHMYVQDQSPEALVPLVQKIKTVMKKNGVELLPLWNTEIGWWVDNEDGTPATAQVINGGWRKLGPAEEAGAFLQQTFLLSLSLGVGRVYWYAWDNIDLGLMEPTAKKPKPAAERWRSTVENLLGATQVNCRQESNKWRCNYIRADGTRDEVSWITHAR